MLVQGLKALAETSVVVDASALLRFDSSALAVLRDLAEVYGIAELLAAE